MNNPVARCITARILIVVLSTFVPLAAIAGGATTSKLTMKGLKARANGDHTNALLFLDQACTQGDPAGCFVQGVMYVEDDGVWPNLLLPILISLVLWQQCREAGRSLCPQPRQSVNQQIPKLRVF